MSKTGKQTSAALGAFVAAESWRRVEREFWPSVAEKIDWENLNLDGARFEPRGDRAIPNDLPDELRR